MIEIKEDKSTAVVSQIESLCKAYGYELMHAYNAQYREGGRKFLNISIRNDGTNKYAPELSVDKRSHDVMIMTTSYGSIGIDEYKEFIKACNNAYDLAKKLSEINFDDLPVERD